MLFHLPYTYRTFTRKHRSLLLLMFVDALPRYGTSVLYALLSILIAHYTNEILAGVAFSALAVYELLISDPLGGALADRVGARTTLKAHATLLCVTGALLFFANSSLWQILMIGVVLFTAYGLRVTGTYLLRLSKQNEGGLVFGLSENFASLAYFFATLSIPFFSHFERARWVAVLLFLGGLAYLFFLQFLPDDRKKVRIEQAPLRTVFNPIKTLVHGWHFVRKNDHYPTMVLANSLFEGIFFSTIWFLFPLRFAQLASSGAEGLELGIYDLVTMFLAGACGYLADRYNWRFVHGLGWVFILIGVILLPLLSFSFGLIVAGFVIALGDNLSAFAANHILAKHDMDHREDGAFMALSTMIRSAGYVVAPTVTGILYQRFGFSMALSFTCAMSAGIAVWMLVHTLILKEKRVASRKRMLARA